MELIVLVIVGYVFGKISETKHISSIKKRESGLRSLPMITYGKKQQFKNYKEGFLCTGSVVIANDYYKKVGAFIMNLIGGRVTFYESLLDRARREAALRMKESAHEQGAKAIVNVRFEVSTIGGQSQKKGGIGSVEILVYGTALVAT